MASPVPKTRDILAIYPWILYYDVDDVIRVYMGKWLPHWAGATRVNQPLRLYSRAGRRFDLDDCNLLLMVSEAEGFSNYL